jgi:ribosomal protein L44E
MSSNNDNLLGSRIGREGAQAEFSLPAHIQSLSPQRLMNFVRNLQGHRETAEQRAEREEREQLEARERREQRRIRGIVEGGYSDDSSGDDGNEDMEVDEESEEDFDEHMSDASSEDENQRPVVEAAFTQDNSEAYTNFPPSMQAHCPHFMRIMRALADGDPGVLSTFSVLYMSMYEAINHAGYTTREMFSWTRQWDLLAQEVPNGPEIFPSSREMVDEIEEMIRAQARATARRIRNSIENRSPIYEGIESDGEEDDVEDGEEDEVESIYDEDGVRGELIRHYCPDCHDWHEVRIFPPRERDDAAPDEGSEQDADSPNEQDDANPSEEDGQNESAQTEPDRVELNARFDQLTQGFGQSVRDVFSRLPTDDQHNQFEQELRESVNALRNLFSRLPTAGDDHRNLFAPNEGNGQTGNVNSNEQTATSSPIQGDEPDTLPSDQGSDIEDIGGMAPRGQLEGDISPSQRESPNSNAQAGIDFSEIDPEWLDEAMLVEQLGEFEAADEHQFPGPGPPR